MNAWSAQDAKARFREFLDTCLSDGPQMVTRCGTEAAVLVPAVEWRRRYGGAQPSLKELLLSDSARTDALMPPRAAAQRRVMPPGTCS